MTKMHFLLRLVSKIGEANACGINELFWKSDAYARSFYPAGFWHNMQKGFISKNISNYQKNPPSDTGLYSTHNNTPSLQRKLSQYQFQKCRFFAKHLGKIEMIVHSIQPWNWKTVNVSETLNCYVVNWWVKTMKYINDVCERHSEWWWNANRMLERNNGVRFILNRNAFPVSLLKPFIPCMWKTR